MNFATNEEQPNDGRLALLQNDPDGLYDFIDNVFDVEVIKSAFSELVTPSDRLSDGQRIAALEAHALLDDVLEFLAFEGMENWGLSASDLQVGVGLRWLEHLENMAAPAEGPPARERREFLERWVQSHSLTACAPEWLSRDNPAVAGADLKPLN